MATFSVNQVRQLYVAKELKSPSVISTDKAGAIAVKADNTKTHLYFEYMGAGGLTRSDLIDIKNILSIKASDADSLSYDLAKYKVTLDTSINAGNPVGGQDYILNINFKNYIGISDEDQLTKFGSVRVYSGMTKSDFYKQMALSLVKNFNEITENLINVYLETGGSDPATVAGTPTLVTSHTKEETLTGTYTGLVIEEAEQDWILGTLPQVNVNFIILPYVITVDADERIWGVVNKVASTTSVKDGKKIADLEYFCMGERGDIYRMIGFPNVIRTEYLVDSTLQYNVLDIHYCYTGSNENVQKSEKTLTLVAPKVGDNNSVSNKLMNDIIGAINTATGLNVTKLDASAGG